MKILITGTAGFIGFHLVEKFVKEGYDILGIDNVNDYYDVGLKYDRLRETGISFNSEFIIHNSELKEEKKINSKESKEEIEFVQSEKYENYRFVKMDLMEKERLLKLFEIEKFDYVIHLAAQAGVRYSITNPQAYIDSNIIGFFNILEACSLHTPKHLIFASSSSVYGENKEIPFSTEHRTDHPVSLYAATKKSNEVMAHAYSILYGIPMTGLRFFTVYGPWGRPDMAYYSFSKSIMEGKNINLFNNGNMKRDFTYIDDIVHSIKILLEKEPQIINNDCVANFRLFNIGNSKPIELRYFIHLLEVNLGNKAILENKPMQKGEVEITYADNNDLYEYINYRPKVKIEEGLNKFCYWYKEYKNIEQIN
ncbi:MAG: NAD-dependent epimerase/dehydratase family protein [Ignavibacteria bacterium]